jgi:hypothetical protein
MSYVKTIKHDFGVLLGGAICLVLFIMLFSLGADMLLKEIIILLIFISAIAIVALGGWHKSESYSWMLLFLLFIISFFNSFYILIGGWQKMLLLFMLNTALCGLGAVISIMGVLHISFSGGPFFGAQKKRGSASGTPFEKSRAEKEAQEEGVFVDGALPKKKTYIASIDGRTYHDPECRLAKKIHESKMVWFVNKGEAEEKKYGPCKLCIE